MIIRAISDLHGFLPTIEECDLLLIAGDLCPDYVTKPRQFPDPEGQLQWLNKDFAEWYRTIPAQRVIVTYGNHDWVGEKYDNPNILIDRMVECAGFDVWVTPWSNPFGGWAFMMAPQTLAEAYAAIPVGCDVIVSHQPPYGYGDTVEAKYWVGRGSEDPHLGSKELLATIERVQPRLVVCGHIHSGYGCFKHGSTYIYNVACVNEAYELVRGATVVVLPEPTMAGQVSLSTS